MKGDIPGSVWMIEEGVFGYDLYLLLFLLFRYR